MNKKYYLIYQITNNINGKIYIGKHETNNLDDDYFGSGTYLKRAQKKYGLENFTKTILYYLQNEEEMNLLEKMVVNEAFCKRKDTYNIKIGGNGGWDYVNLNSDYAIGTEKRKVKFHSIGGKTRCQQIKQQTGKSLSRYILDSMTDEEYKEYIQKQSIKRKEFYKQNPNFMRGKNNPRYGKKNSQHTRKLISEAMKTDSNYMKGAKRYVNYETEENIILHDGDSIPEGFESGWCFDFKKHKQHLLEKQLKQQIKEQKQQERQLKREQIEKEKQEREKRNLENIEIKKCKLKNMQEWYIKYGWESMVAHFNYQHTIQAFSQQYIKYFGISITNRKFSKRK